MLSAKHLVASLLGNNASSGHSRDTLAAIHAVLGRSAFRHRHEL
jgi:hypothetical protein